MKFLLLVGLIVCCALQAIVPLIWTALLFFALLGVAGIWKEYFDGQRHVAFGIGQNLLSYVISTFVKVAVLFIFPELLYHLSFPIVFGLLYFIGKKNYLLMLVAWLPIGAFIGFLTMALMNWHTSLSESEGILLNGQVVLCLMFELIYDTISRSTKSRRSKASS